MAYSLWTLAPLVFLPSWGFILLPRWGRSYFLPHRGSVGILSRSTSAPIIAAICSPWTTITRSDVISARRETRLAMWPFVGLRHNIHRPGRSKRSTLLRRRLSTLTLRMTGAQRLCDVCCTMFPQRLMWAFAGVPSYLVVHPACASRRSHFPPRGRTGIPSRLANASTSVAEPHSATASGSHNSHSGGRRGARTAKGTFSGGKTFFGPLLFRLSSHDLSWAGQSRGLRPLSRLSWACGPPTALLGMQPVHCLF